MPVKSNVNNFIAKAREVHGDRYSYDKFEYVTTQTKGIITCKVHGDFLQRPNGHLCGSGCPKCGGRTKKTTESFIEEAKAVHGDRYDYSKTTYKKIKINVTITCAEHGDFEQRPDLHVRGHGCPVCAIDDRTSYLFDDNESFIAKSIKVHGDRYDYSKVDYVSCYKNVTVVCRDHGEFSISPKSHTSGVGCKKCSRGGFSEGSDGFLYIARSKCGGMNKIGITNDPISRLVSIRSVTPFDVDMVYVFGCSNARDVETMVKRKYQTIGLSGFIGCTEWVDVSEDELFKFCCENVINK